MLAGGMIAGFVAMQIRRQLARRRDIGRRDHCQHLWPARLAGSCGPSAQATLTSPGGANVCVMFLDIGTSANWPANTRRRKS
jgi:hypothetical protein